MTIRYVTSAERKRMARMAEQGASLREIAIANNRCRKTVLRHLHKLEMKTRFVFRPGKPGFVS